MGQRGEVFSTKFVTNDRTYFFNVKENRNGDVFLQIVESKIKDGEDDRRAIVVFADDMQKFLGGMESSLSFIDKDRKERAKQRAAKKAEKEAKFGSGAKNDEDRGNGKKIYRRKGESRLVAEKRSEKTDDGIKRTGKVIHVTSKRASDTAEY